MKVKTEKETEKEKENLNWCKDNKTKQKAKKKSNCKVRVPFSFIDAVDDDGFTSCSQQPANIMKRKEWGLHHYSGSRGEEDSKTNQTFDEVHDASDCKTER